MIGRTIAHYRIIEKLGEGGMGEVYLAEDTSLDRKVALKFLPDSISQDPEARERLIREAKAASKLSHPNIVTIYAVEQADEQHFITMEYVEGRSLKQVTSSGDLDICRIIETAIQMGDGLAAAHKAGVVHRDVKSDNVILTPEGRVKVMDFGLATWRGASHLTKEGSTVGTMAYMSPEQAQGQEVDQRTDLWSLGVILYEMVTRRLPFEGEHDAALAYSIVNEAPHPLARYSADVSDELQRIVSKCLNKNRDERYQSASDLVADLRALRRLSSTGTVPVAQPSRKRSRLMAALAVLGVAVIAVGAALLWNPISSEPEVSTPDRKMIAVLPFENLGDPADEYFADGITDEITSRLTKLSALGVISRSSAIQYKNTDKDAKQIAEELGVDFILEGTIRWDKSGPADKVRITPQLIDVRDNTHFWAENYEREMSSIFDVQVEIATNVVSVLDLSLIQQEQEALRTQPTDNVEAYQAYLKGMSYLWEADYTKDNMYASMKLMERAVELDPDFVEAKATLADVHANIYHFAIDRTESRLDAAREAIDKAVALDPDHPDVLLAQGTYYYVQRDFAKALELFNVARKRSPGNSKVVWAIAATYRRQGRFEDAIREFKKYLEIDPRSAFGYLDLGFTYSYIQRYQKADSCFDRAIALAPDQSQAYHAKADIHQSWKGDLQKAREVLESAPGESDASSHTWWIQGLLERDYEAALTRLAGEETEFIENQLVKLPTILCAAECYRLMGNSEKARVAYDSARSLLEPMVTELPDDFRLHNALGIAYGGLDQKEEAIREADSMVALVPIEMDALIGTYVLRDQAYIYAMVGEYETAIDKLAYLMSVPHEYFGLGHLRLDPRLDSLRSHPRFQALIEKYEKEYGV